MSNRRRPPRKHHGATELLQVSGRRVAGQTPRTPTGWMRGDSGEAGSAYRQSRATMSRHIAELGAHPAALCSRFGPTVTEVGLIGVYMRDAESEKEDGRERPGTAMSGP